jgi:hypothetical protein
LSVYTKSLNNTNQYKVPTQYSLGNWLVALVGAVNSFVFVALLATAVGVETFTFAGQPRASIICTSITLRFLIAAVAAVAAELYRTRAHMKSTAEKREQMWAFPGIYTDNGEETPGVRDRYGWLPQRSRPRPGWGEDVVAQRVQEGQEDQEDKNNDQIMILLRDIK